MKTKSSSLSHQFSCPILFPETAIYYVLLCFSMFNQCLFYYFLMNQL